MPCFGTITEIGCGIFILQMIEICGIFGWAWDIAMVFTADRVHTIGYHLELKRNSVTAHKAYSLNIFNRMDLTERMQVIEYEVEVNLRPTNSRPVRLGIGPPYGTLDQILSCSSFFC
jgi:hypothetical protein